MTDLLIRNARLIDPASGLDQLGAILVIAGRIADFGAVITPPDGIPSLDADGAILCPGLVDMRAEVGEPGAEHRETIASAAQAAAAGGITTLAALPDSTPAIDDPALVRHMRARGEETGSLTILPYAAATKGCRGEELAELGLLREAGAAAFTDGARAIASARMMRLVLSYARPFGARVAQHPEDPSLAAGGAATSGELATRLGLPAIPAAAEALMVARDLRLLELAGGSLHFAHVSTAEALALIRAAKSRGLDVSCDTAPPYFDLNETAIGNFRTYAKLSPPLRAESDRLAVLAALADGTIDAIATDHAPHTPQSKELPFEEAPPGMLGVETALAVALTELVETGLLSIADVLARLSWQPARIAGLDQLGHGLPIAAGNPANICVIDPQHTWVVDAEQSASKSRNTPWAGRKLTGRVRHTIRLGHPVVMNGAITT